MSHDEAHLLGQLHAADAASPPPDGSAITPLRLQQRLRRRRRQAMAGSAVAVLSAFVLWSLATTPHATVASDPAEKQLERKLAAIDDRVDRLLTSLANPPRVADLDSRHLRYELAAVRARASNALWRSQRAEPTTSPIPSKKIR